MSHRHFLAAVIATATLAAPFTAEAASPYVRQCKAPITTVGKHKVKPTARRIAKQSWGQQTVALHGSVWASLTNASVSQNECSFGQGNWTCTFTARPCRYVNTQISPDQPGLMLKRAPGGLVRP